MLGILYVAVVLFSVGFVDLSPVPVLRIAGGEMNLEDLLLGLLLIGSVPGYVRRRSELDQSAFRRMERAWILLIVVLGIASWSSPAGGFTERVVNLRFVQGSLLFFPTVAVLRDEHAIRRLARIAVAMAIGATLLALVQSLRGPTNLFDSPLYDIGAWGGNKGYVGNIARVNLPSSNWVAWVSLLLFAVVLQRNSSGLLLLMSFLLLTVVINFARSLWIGMILAALAEYLVLRAAGALGGGTLRRAILVPAVLVGGMAAAVAFVFPELVGSVAGRIDEGLTSYAEESGTWGWRVGQGVAALELWRSYPLLGVGTNYISVFPSFIDFGLPAILVSAGLAGLAALVWLWWVCLKQGGATARHGGGVQDLMTTAIGAGLVGQVVLMAVYQQWVIPYVTAILGVASGAAVAAAVTGSVPEENDTGLSTPAGNDEGAISS